MQVVLLILIAFVAVVGTAWIDYRQRQKSAQSGRFRFPIIEFIIFYTILAGPVGQLIPPWKILIAVVVALACVAVVHRLTYPFVFRCSMKYGKWVESVGFRLGQACARLFYRVKR